MKQLSRRILKDLFNSYPQGVALVEAHKPEQIVSVNAALELICGYTRPEIIGQDIFFFADAMDRDTGITHLSDVRESGESKVVPIAVVRENGDIIHVDVRLEPIQDARSRTTHIAAFYEHRLHGDDQLTGGSTQGADLMLRRDKATGLFSRQYFEDFYPRQWRLARREQQTISVLVFEPDYFDEFSEKFGVAAVNGCLRKVGALIDGSFRRPGDVVARYQDNQFVVAALNVDREKVHSHAEGVAQRVRGHCIHHPRSPISKYLTLSIGAAACVPQRNQDANAVLKEAFYALKQAREFGCDQVVIAA